MQNSNPKNRYKVIYNPHAGLKRNYFAIQKKSISLEEIKFLLKKYQIEADFYPTTSPGHATKLAKRAQSEGYKSVLVAGGDGTVGEAANGLVGTNITLGILPVGSFMNVARMLSIPLDLEKAIMLIKVGRTRKIDLGMITSVSGKILPTPYYFLESAGLGIEAQLHQYILEFEHGDIKAPFRLLRTLFEYFRYKTTIQMDQQIITTRASVINISNGPFSGPALPIAPTAKLNDHILTISIFKMKKWDLLHYFYKLWFGKKIIKKPTIYQSKSIKISTKSPRPIHADARFYGETPVEIKVLPNGLNLYTGFPNPNEDITSLNKKTFLDP